MKSLKIKLKLNYNQKLILETLSDEHRKLYNFLLSCVKNNKTDFKQLNLEYRNYRHNNNLTINSKSSQNTCRSLINNIKSYYSLRKKDKTSKFPYKFKSWKYFKSFQLDWNKGNGGFKINENILELNLNNTKNKLKIELNKELLKKFNISNKTIKTITFNKEFENYYLICVFSENNTNDIILNKDNFISLDLGITNLYTLFSNVIENQSLINNRFINLQKQVEYCQSVLDKKKQYSNKWKKLNKRFLRLKHKISNKNKDFQHKVSTNLIKICKNNDIGTILCGDIKTKKIINKNNKKIKSTSKTFGLSRFKTFLEYKSKNEGIDFQKVNEYNTSKINCLTNEVEFDSNLSNRKVQLNKNLEIDRDLNSAINIVQKIKGKWLTQYLIQTNKFELNKIYMNSNSETNLIYI